MGAFQNLFPKNGVRRTIVEFSLLRIQEYFLSPFMDVKCVERLDHISQQS